MNGEGNVPLYFLRRVRLLRRLRLGHPPFQMMHEGDPASFPIFFR